MIPRVLSVVFAAAACTGFALPLTAQTALPQARTEPAEITVTPGAAGAHDLEVEVAFWETVKDSGDPMLYLSYLEQFPDGAFRVIARNRLDALWDRAIRAFDLLDQMGVALDDGLGSRTGPSTGTGRLPAGAAQQPIVQRPPVVVAPAPAPAPEPVTWRLVRNTQNQLAKHGCYKGVIDAVWGAGSQAAMKRFNRRAGTSWSVLRPTTEAVNSMRDLTKVGIRICR